MDNQQLIFLSLYQLVESHLDPLRMTEGLQDQILQSFLFICEDRTFIDDSSGETFYSIPYQEITECIYAHDFEVSDELNSVIEGLIEPLKKLLKIDGLSSEELKLKENKEAVHKLNAYKRFVSHIQLAVCQKKFIGKQVLDVVLQVNQIKQDNKKLTKDLSDSKRNISELKAEILGLQNDLKDGKQLLKDSRDIILSSVLDAKSANSEASSAKNSVQEIKITLDDVQKETTQALESARKAQKDAEDSKTQFVTILGIFASIIVALFGGMSLVKAAVELLTNDGSLPVFVFVVAVLLLSFTILLVFLTSWITSLNTKEASSYNLMKGMIFIGLLSAIAVSGAFIFTLKDSKSSDLKQQKTDIEFKISADKTN